LIVTIIITYQQYPKVREKLSYQQHERWQNSYQRPTIGKEMELDLNSNSICNNFAIEWQF
jgi:hypothetical protein